MEHIKYFRNLEGIVCERKIKNIRYLDEYEYFGKIYFLSYLENSKDL